MGQLEEKSKKRTRNEKLLDLVIGSVAITGVLATALVAPNVLQALPKLGLIPKPRQKEYIAASRRRAIKEGFIVDREGALRVTPKGSKRLESLALNLSTLTKKKRWDEKWRVLIFDIPERRRAARLHVRLLLSSAGFVRLQDSVWVYPYPCEEYVALLKADARIGRDLLYLVVDAIDPFSDLALRERFDLRIPEHLRKFSGRTRSTTGAPNTENIVLKTLLDTLFGPDHRAR